MSACVRMCVCPWSGPILSWLKLLCMPLLKHFLHFTNKLHVLHFHFVSLVSVLLSVLPSFPLSLFLPPQTLIFPPYLIWLFKSALSPSSFPSSPLLSFIILYTPHPFFFSSLLFLQQLFFLSSIPLLTSTPPKLLPHHPLPPRFTPTSPSLAPVPLLLSLFQASSQETFMCVKVYLCQLEVLGKKEECVCVCIKKEGMKQQQRRMDVHAEARPATVPKPLETRKHPLKWR